jgi:succinate--hydroxymethylglutarate CoA-transferase
VLKTGLSLYITTLIKINDINIILRKETTSYWLTIFKPLGIPCSSLNNISKALEHPQIVARNLIKKVEHPDFGPLSFCGNPVKFDGADHEIRRYPPRLGEHTQEILLELGYSLDEIDIYKKKGITL